MIGHRRDLNPHDNLTSTLSRLSYSWASVSLTLYLCDHPTSGPALSLLCTCLTVLPRRIPPCHLFDLITMLALRRERGWVTLHLTTSLPSFCIFYCLPAFPSLKANLLPSTITPLSSFIRYSVGVNWESSPDRHQESHQTPVGPRH